MTREEAIKVLNMVEAHGLADEAKQMAIKALSQEPCEDAISREDVEECKELMTDINGDTVYAVRISDIRQLPSVTQKSGKWIKKGNTLKCAFCGAKGEDIKDDYCFNYCPNCGAKMESEDKE